MAQLDLGTVVTWLAADAPRVTCAEHGVVVAAVPWARHKAGFTKTFEESVAWLTTNCPKAAVCQYMRISWRTVGRIIDRVVSELGDSDPLDGLKRIGIDEISGRKSDAWSPRTCQ